MPMIEQYADEKAIDVMAAELKLDQTVLAHTNEMYVKQDAELDGLKEKAHRHRGLRAGAAR